MKRDKIYKLIFNGIINQKERPMKFEIFNDYVFITPNNYFGFVVSKKETPFNLEMIKTTENKLDLLSVVKPENLLRKTNHYVMIARHGLTNILSGNDRKVYINTKYLSYFEDYAEFYQEKDHTLVVVVECEEVVGAIMPLKHNEEEM